MQSTSPPKNSCLSKVTKWRAVLPSCVAALASAPWLSNTRSDSEDLLIADNNKGDHAPSLERVPTTAPLSSRSADIFPASGPEAYISADQPARSSESASAPCAIN